MCVSLLFVCYILIFSRAKTKAAVLHLPLRLFLPFLLSFMHFVCRQCMLTQVQPNRRTLIPPLLNGPSEPLPTPILPGLARACMFLAHQLWEFLTSALRRVRCVHVNITLLSLHVLLCVCPVCENLIAKPGSDSAVMCVRKCICQK